MLATVQLDLWRGHLPALQPAGTARLAGEELALEPAAPDVMQGLHEMGGEGDSMTGFWLR